MTSETTNGRFRLNEPLVASQEIDGETILIHFDSGRYFCANPTGSAIVAQLRLGASIAETGESLHARYVIDEPAAKQAVAGFVEVLFAEGLIVPDAVVTSPAAATTKVDGDRLPFQHPELQKFDDLQDLLMLDPIHDVDQAGWPMPAPGNTPGVR